MEPPIWDLRSYRLIPQQQMCLIRGSLLSMSVDPDQKAERTRLAQLLKQLDESPGTQLQSELAALALSARTFDANTADLIACVKGFENLIVNPLLQPEKRRELWEYSYEVVRLFQNAVASGESFLAHCETTVTRRYRKHPFLAEFETQWKAHIEDSPLCMFVKELRGYLLHKESISPMVNRTLTDFSDPYDSLCSIVLSTDGIKAEREDRWKKNSKGREYLDRLHGHINIRRLIDAYWAAVKAFADWLLQREQELNAQALADIEPLNKEIATLLPDVYGEDFMIHSEGARVTSWLGRT